MLFCLIFVKSGLFLFSFFGFKEIRLTAGRNVFYLIWKYGGLVLVDLGLISLALSLCSHPAPQEKMTRKKEKDTTKWKEENLENISYGLNRFYRDDYTCWNMTHQFPTRLSKWSYHSRCIIYFSNFYSCFWVIVQAGTGGLNMEIKVDTMLPKCQRNGMAGSITWLITQEMR